MEKNIESRIRELRKNKSLTLRELAKKMSLTHTSISQWERGIALPKGKNLISLAKELGSSVEWILYGERGSENNNTDVPFYAEISAAAGPGNVGVEAMNDIISLPEVFVEGKSDLVCIRVSGDSMEPYINSGSIVTVDLNDKQIHDGKIYIIRNGDLVRIKMLFRQSQGILLKSYNKFYNDEILSADLSDFEVIGKVCWFFSKA